MLDLKDIADIFAIARDLALVVVCVLVAASVLLILLSVRKLVHRLNEAMDRVDDLLASVAAARDSLAELRDRVRNRSSMGGKGTGGRFNVVTWLLTPIGHVINREFRKRSRAKGDKTR